LCLVRLKFGVLQGQGGRVPYGSKWNQAFRFSQRCSWEFCFSGMWHCQRVYNTVPKGSQIQNFQRNLLHSSPWAIRSQKNNLLTLEYDHSTFLQNIRIWLLCVAASSARRVEASYWTNLIAVPSHVM